MAEVKWIKITTDIFDDEKILLIESMPERDSLLVIWFKLLCLAGRQNNSGVFVLNDRIAFTDEMLATIFRRPLNTVRMALNAFEQFGMVQIIDGVISIPNWEKHQSIDKLEKIKEQNRLRVSKHREKQKMLSCNVTSNVTEDVTVTMCNATDKNKIRLEEDKDICKDKPSTKRFVAPTLEEVEEYILANGYDVDAERFINHYTSNGWMVGRTKMKDWKAAIRNWASKNKKPSLTYNYGNSEESL